MPPKPALDTRHRTSGVAGLVCCFSKIRQHNSERLVASASRQLQHMTTSGLYRQHASDCVHACRSRKRDPSCESCQRQRSIARKPLPEFHKSKSTSSFSRSLLSVFLKFKKPLTVYHQCSLPVAASGICSTAGRSCILWILGIRGSKRGQDRGRIGFCFLHCSSD